MVIGNTFFINRFPNMINAIVPMCSILDIVGLALIALYCLSNAPPTHTSLTKHSVYTLQNFVNKCHNKEHNIVNAWPLVGTG